MIIYADDNMPLAHEFFSALGDVRRFDGRTATAAALQDADVLLVRSVTRVNAALLANNQRLQFVGTATIGTDHLDCNYLTARGVPFTNAAGCNAQSVLEYVLSCLWLYCEQAGRPLAGLCIGVVGCGQIGHRLVRALQLLGCEVLQSDPPRARLEPDFVDTPLDDLLRQADVISLHVPLIKSGPDQTVHLLDAARLARLAPTKALINACRGEVVDNQALLQQAQAGCRRPLFLDVWEGEPLIEQRLLPYCTIATAHIAGHSIEGKVRGTEMLYQALCRQLNVPVRLAMADFLPAAGIHSVTLSGAPTETELKQLSRLLYDVRRDDLLLRQQLASAGFDWLRKHYPPRREFSALQVSGPDVALLHALGFARASDTSRAQEK